MKRKQRSSGQEFVNKAKKVHGDYYDYHKINYVNNKTDIEIICREHGSFWQQPSNHLAGKGCILCGSQKTSDSFRSTVQQFVKKAKKVHKGWYSYERVKYTNNRIKVDVTCPEHGSFLVSPSNHLRGKGCPPCGRLITAETSRRHMTGKTPPNKISLENFIKRANIVHDDHYSYGKVQLVDIKKNIVITCLEHGDFVQRPDHHLQGVGCPTCNQSKGEREINMILDKWKIKYEIQANLFENYRFDFYLTELNTVIEYHGIQHYKAIDFFGGEKALQHNQARDRIKKAHCKGSNLNYVEIPYDVESIEDLLQKELSSIKKMKDSLWRLDNRDQLEFGFN